MIRLSGFTILKLIQSPIADLLKNSCCNILNKINVSVLYNGFIIRHYKF